MKVMLLGLDGMTLSVVKPYIEAGLLPNFKRIMDEGSFGVLRSTIPPVSGPAWVSLACGKNPGKHGIFEFRKRDGYKTKLVTKNTSPYAEPIWKILSRNKKNVAVINVPFTYPPDKVNGIMISGLMTPPNKDVDFTYPHTIKEDLLKLVPDYQLQFLRKTLFSRNKNKLIKEVLKTTQDVRTLTNHFLQKNSWDLFFVVHAGPDRLQHFLWHEVISMDAECVDCYKLFDDALGDILERMDDDTVLFVVSDHGFIATNKIFYLTTFLNKAGLLGTRQRKWINMAFHRINLSNKNRDRLIDLLVSVLIIAKKCLPPVVFDHIFSFLPAPTKDNIDWGKTKLFTVLGHGIIFVNLKGREPQGIVEEEDYAKLCKLVEDELLQLKDPQTGKNIVKAVLKGNEIYSPQYSNTRPDLVVVTNDGYEIRASHGRTVLSEYSQMGRKAIATHHENGLFAAYGKNIKSQQMDADIYDIMPTILYLMGLQIPEDVDGRVLAEIISHDFVAKNEIRFEKSEEFECSEAIELKDAESEAVKKHLKNLGYLD